MEIVNLICGGNLPLEQRESYVGEGSVLGGAGGPVIAEHYTVIGGGAAERDAIALVVGAHAGEGAAAGDAAFEMVNVRGFEIRAGRLIVASIFVESWNRVGVGVTVRSNGLVIG